MRNTALLSSSSQRVTAGHDDSIGCSTQGQAFTEASGRFPEGRRHRHPGQASEDRFRHRRAPGE